MFVNDLRNADGVREVIEDMKEMGVQLVAVGFGEQAKLSQLEEIAEKNALHFEEFESARSLGTAIVQGINRFNYEVYYSVIEVVFIRRKPMHDPG